MLVVWYHDTIVHLDKAEPLGVKKGISMWRNGG
jgi:hypothetical protein